ncbi:MAG: hypothetical protein PWP03_799 [Candidatus Woesearchaeota archaeon]|nr:hypothetical protein [Candidatus Woesearchaeota archaeon]MDN5328161.1 hypothetical protein [Candidatus Woesearchaeota archaeon]
MNKEEFKAYKALDVLVNEVINLEKISKTFADKVNSKDLIYVLEQDSYKVSEPFKAPYFEKRISNAASLEVILPNFEVLLKSGEKLNLEKLKEIKEDNAALEKYYSKLQDALGYLIDLTHTDDGLTHSDLTQVLNDFAESPVINTDEGSLAQTAVSVEPQEQEELTLKDYKDAFRKVYSLWLDVSKEYKSLVSKGVIKPETDDFGLYFKIDIFKLVEGVKEYSKKIKELEDMFDNLKLENYELKDLEWIKKQYAVIKERVKNILDFSSQFANTGLLQKLYGGMNLLDKENKSFLNPLSKIFYYQNFQRTNQMGEKYE